MSKLDPPKVLIDASALVALADPAHPHHAATADLYRDLLSRYERDECWLVALDRHVRPLVLSPTPHWTELVRWHLRPPRRGVFAALDLLHVGQQHLNAAYAMTTTPADQALTLVMCERHRVREILTLDLRYQQYDLDVLTPAVPTAE